MKIILYLKCHFLQQYDERYSLCAIFINHKNKEDILMKNKIREFLTNHSALLCAIAAFAAINACDVCKFLWYQPEEPEGLAEFAAKHKK